MNFKQFIIENCEAEEALEKWEDLLHHISEEELIACKVNEIVLVSKNKNGVTIKFIADCNDNPRSPGYQKDLSDKLTARLTKHDIKGLSPIKAKVYHVNMDPR